MDLIVSYWPNLSIDVYNLLSNIFVNENERFNIDQIMKHETIIEWSKLKYNIDLNI